MTSTRTSAGTSGGTSAGTTVAAGPTLAGRVATSVRWSMLDQVVQQVVRFGLTLLLTRLTSPQAYGLIGIAFVFTGIASFVGDLGMGHPRATGGSLDPDEFGRRPDVVRLRDRLLAAA